ncbi:MAG: signal peptide peptidase SppA, partial [Thermodesulfobacteriota bacterium]
EKTIKSLIDEGPFLAQEALKKGLIDETLYEFDLEKEIEDRMSLKIQRISARSFLKLFTIAETGGSLIDRIRGNSDTIALVADSGMITLGESRGSGSAKTLGSETLIRILKRLADDKRIKAIVLRISSPGGSGVASDLIRRQVKSVSEKKPVVISMSNVAASGGYMIALGANKIVADSMSITGSIGIVSGKFNLNSFLKKLGVTKEWITRGKRALMFSSNKGFTKKEEEKLDAIMESFYRDFVEKVAQARTMEYESAELLARGRVWTGKQAKEKGLVDELGGINEAIEIAKKEAEIPEEVFPTIRFVSKPKGIQFNPFGKSFALGVEFDSLMRNLQTLEREKILALMPFWIEVK